MSDDYDDPSLNIEIRTSADTGGVQDATKAVQGLSDAAGERSGGLTHSLRELSGTSRHTGEIFRGLEGAMNGGARGVGEMVRGLRALIIVSGEAMAATGLGGIIALLAGAGLGAMMVFSKSTHEAGTELGKASTEADKLKASIEAAGKAMDGVFKPVIEDAKALVAEMEKLDKMQKESEASANRMAAAKAGLAGAQLDLEEQNSLAVAKTPEDREHIKAVFEQRRKVGKLNEEGAASTNAVYSAEAEAKRTADLAEQARQTEYGAAAPVRGAQSAFDEAKDRAARLNAAAIEAASKASAANAEVAKVADRTKLGTEAAALAASHISGAKPLNEAAATAAEAAKEATRDALTKEAALKKAEGNLEETKGITGKVTDAAAAAARKYDEAKELDAIKQKEIATQKEILQQIELGKQQDAAAEAAKRLAEAADKAAKALDKKSEKEEKEPKETKADAQAADAAENHRDAAAERAVERMSKGAEHLKNAVAKHAEKTAESHEATVDHLEKSSRSLERTNRVLVNAGSYNASP